MSICHSSLLVVITTLVCHVLAIYSPLHEYRGATFFDGWDYWGNVDNTTWGNVTYLNQADSTSHQLTYINAAGNAIVKVDNTTTIAPATLVNRPSVRITTHASYDFGTLWVIDVVHIPYGCSVWPSFWSLGANLEWPYAGEIDIIEAINLMTYNQMALHTTPGCTKVQNDTQTGNTLETDCSTDQGCLVSENKPHSYGQGFAQAGGGVWAVEYDSSAINMWFWGRADIPPSIQSATSQSQLDTAAFGAPSAIFPSTGCDFTKYFGPQQLVISITLCGVWAGVPGIYTSTCPGDCINSNIIGPGSPTYDNAYFEIPYIRTYTNSTPPTSSASSSASTAVTVITTTATPTAGASSSSGARNFHRDFSISLLGAVVVLIFYCL